MRTYGRFLAVGLTLGLFTEFVLKLVARAKPSGFVIVVIAYPIIVSFAYAASRLIDHIVASRWIGDMLHYAGSGIGGMAIEWTLLGNGPGSNAFQLGMFAMWTTFCFGPRILTRETVIATPRARRFWIAFVLIGTLITVAVLAATGKPKIVLAVLTLSAAYLLWSLWLLRLAYQDRCGTIDASARQA